MEQKMAKEKDIRHLARRHAKFSCRGPSVMRRARPPFLAPSISVYNYYTVTTHSNMSFTGCFDEERRLLSPLAPSISVYNYYTGLRLIM